MSKNEGRGILQSAPFDLCEKVAEEEGFEPPVPCGTHDFESRALNHSAIPPESRRCGGAPHLRRGKNVVTSTVAGKYFVFLFVSAGRFGNGPE